MYSAKVESKNRIDGLLKNGEKRRNSNDEARKFEYLGHIMRNERRIWLTVVDNAKEDSWEVWSTL